MCGGVTACVGCFRRSGRSRTTGDCTGRHLVRHGESGRGVTRLSVAVLWLRCFRSRCLGE